MLEVPKVLELKLYRNSATPDDADYIGQIKFAGESDTGVKTITKITGKILDASNTSEDGILEFAHIKALHKPSLVDLMIVYNF